MDYDAHVLVNGICTTEKSGYSIGNTFINKVKKKRKKDKMLKMTRKSRGKVANESTKVPTQKQEKIKQDKS